MTELLNEYNIALVGRNIKMRQRWKKSMWGQGYRVHNVCVFKCVIPRQSQKKLLLGCQNATFLEKPSLKCKNLCSYKNPSHIPGQKLNK